MNEFIGKVALITGAGRGLGKDLALAFSSLGAIVAANDILTSGGNARAYVFDIAKRMPIEAMVAEILSHFGRIDILVNHASVQPEEYILDMDEWEFHRTLDVNLGGAFFTMQQVGRVMQQQGGGVIVNLVSTKVHANIGKGHAAHLASQVGLVGLTSAAAHEFAAHNIRVNAVCTGTLEGNFVTPRKWDLSHLHQWFGAYPSARLGSHPDLVSLVLFLCSSAASSLSGQIVSID
jgi:NAD(P)-dependent dehydrogenase (short-subunit alcohol dehydrogenase family)